jgi:hypothetical protein
VLPEDVVLGAGLSGAWDLPTATLTLTGRSILDVYDAATSTLISENVERIYLNGLVGTHLLPGMMAISAAQANVHAPVHGVTTRNLASTTGGLVLPSNFVHVLDGATVIYTYSNYDGTPYGLAVDGRVLVAAQSNAAENGIYTRVGSILVKSTELISVGHLIPVTTGRMWAGAVWYCTSANYFRPLGGKYSPTARVVTNPVGASATWQPLTSLGGSTGASARDWVLDVEVTWTAASGAGVRYWGTARGAYLGSVAGDMVPMGDGVTFGLPWEGETEVRLRARVDGSNIYFEGLADPSTGTTWQYNLEVTSNLRQIVEY